MSTLTCYDSNGNALSELYQWDVDRTVVIGGAEIMKNTTIHFCNRRHNRALVVPATISGNDIMAPIPNILLQDAEVLVIYIYQESTDGEQKTTGTLAIPVKPRQKPEDYTYTENIEYANWVKLEQQAIALLEELSGIDTSRLAGKLTEDGGEIFNDYENNQALAPYTRASGSYTIAGMKRHYYSKIVVTDNTGVITLSDALDTEVFSGVIGYSAGDLISIVWGSKYPNCATIESIDSVHGTITIKDFNEDLSNKFDESGDCIRPAYSISWAEDAYSLYVLKKPNIGTVSLGRYSSAEGLQTVASGGQSHAEGNKTVASGTSSHAEGHGTRAEGSYSHAEGYLTLAQYMAHAEGSNTKANGLGAHAEGHNTTAKGLGAHAEGRDTTALEQHSHAEGGGTIAKGIDSHAEGSGTTAKGIGSHAEGCSTDAEGNYSHAEGSDTEALGINAHAEGRESKAIGDWSHAEGYGTIASRSSSHVQGRFNIEDTEERFAHIVGGGTSQNNRKNIHTVDWIGNAWYSGKITAGADPTEDMDLTTKKYVHANFAPADFGYLGKAETDDVWKALIENCLSQMPADSVRRASVMDDGRWSVTIHKHLEGYATVAEDTYWYVDSGEGVYHKRVRSLYNGVWGEWEWVNPPTVAGYEYRTTERYNGKAVYVYLVDFGTLLNNAIKSVQVTPSRLPITDIVSYETLVKTPDPFVGHRDISLDLSDGNIDISILAEGDESNITAKVLIKYTLD